MATTITTPSDVYTAAIIDGYRAERRTRTVLSPILGTNEKAPTFRPAALRTGTFRLLFADYATAAALVDDLSSLTAAAEFADTVSTSLDMTFIPDGQITLELEPRSRVRWWVGIDFQEVLP